MKNLKRSGPLWPHSWLRAWSEVQQHIHIYVLDAECKWLCIYLVLTRWEWNEIVWTRSCVCCLSPLFPLHSQRTTPTFLAFFKTVVRTNQCWNRGFHDPLMNDLNLVLFFSILLWLRKTWHVAHELHSLLLQALMFKLMSFLNIYRFKIFRMIPQIFQVSTPKPYPHPPPPPHPLSHVRHVLLWMDALYLTTFGLLKKHPPTTILTLVRAKIFFDITPIGFVWKKKVIHTKDALRVSKTWANFHFGWTNPVSAAKKKRNTGHTGTTWLSVSIKSKYSIVFGKIWRLLIHQYWLRCRDVSQS